VEERRGSEKNRLARAAGRGREDSAPGSCSSACWARSPHWCSWSWSSRWSSGRSCG